MVAKRQRRTRDDGLNEYERGLRTLQALAESDEDPAQFWGPNWQQLDDAAEADEREGRVDHAVSFEEFVEMLMNPDSTRADVWPK